MLCPRSISFTIPGLPGLLVTAVENGGNIDFTLDVQDSATRIGDLRALFFHLANDVVPAGLTVTGGAGLVTEALVQANSVLDLGNGANLIGVAGPFDVGIEFGSEGIGKGDDLSGPVTFTLDATQDLTLDAIAHVQFGARITSVGVPGRNRNDSEKLIFIAPAAPDAVDDPNNVTNEDVPLTINFMSGRSTPRGNRRSARRRHGQLADAARICGTYSDAAVVPLIWHALSRNVGRIAGWRTGRWLRRSSFRAPWSGRERTLVFR